MQMRAQAVWKTLCGFFQGHLDVWGFVEQQDSNTNIWTYFVFFSVYLKQQKDIYKN